jgi:Tfp pilus assembly protein PilV
MNVPTTSMRARRQGGFTLIEALIALLVMAFGMLAIASMQITISRNSDVAKQRSEAVRLAQLKLEELRSFDSAAVTASSTYTYAADVVSGGPETINPTVFNGVAGSNTAFTRQWWVTSDGVNAAVASDLQKWLRVNVSWTDRSNEVQTVTLRSVISRSDPVDLGTLFTGPGGSSTRTPKNRNINVPYPAVDLADGKSSAFRPPGAGVSYVFDNTTGDVLGYCTQVLNEGDAVVLADDPNTVAVETPTAGCTAQPSLLLSGYIRFVIGNYNQGQVDNYFTNPTDATKPLAGGNGIESQTGSTGVAVKFIEPSLSAGATDSNATCYWQRQYVARKNATGQEEVVAEGANPSWGTTFNVSSRFIAYSCIVIPVDHDADTGTAKRWSGMPVITTDGSWSLGTTSSTLTLCRYTGNYISDSALSNSEHPLYYRGVTGALDNQNYVVVTGNVGCPYDSASNTATADYVNNNTTAHQTLPVAANTIPYGGLRSGTNSGGVTRNGGIATEEPSTTTTELPMF